MLAPSLLTLSRLVSSLLLIHFALGNRDATQHIPTSAQRRVWSCASFRAALKAPHIHSIEITRSLTCNSTNWNSSVYVTRDLTIQGRRRKTRVPVVDWGTSIRTIVADNGSCINFRDIVFYQNDMGIGNINMLFFQAEHGSFALFEFLVVGISSCPWKLDVEHFRKLHRPRTFRGQQEARQFGEDSVEARDIVLHWSSEDETPDAMWQLHHVMFTCNVPRNSQKLMTNYMVTILDSGHGDSGIEVHYDQGSRSIGRLVIYVLTSVCGVVGLLLAVYCFATCRVRQRATWKLDMDEGSIDEGEKIDDDDDNDTDEKFSHLEEGEPADVLLHNKMSPTPDNWTILDSDVALEAPLGHGEFGKVYRGIWQGSTVAVKVIKHNDKCLQTNVGAPLEAFFARHISHPNVVQTYQITKKMSPSDVTPTQFFGGTPSEKKRQKREERQSGSCSSEDMFGSFDGAAEPHSGDHETWLILEYCDKGSLTEAVTSGIFRDPHNPPHFRMSFVTKTALEIASAMNYLHSVRIIHGDLKTGNVLLKGDGSDPRGFICKVGDFGLSRFLAEDSHIETFTCGTVTHMPPELLQEGHLTSAADVYSFGILLWELFSGKKPHQGKNQGEIVLAVVNHEIRPAFPHGVPQEFRELIESCWVQDYVKRPLFPSIIDKLSVLLHKYEKEEGLDQGAGGGGGRPSLHAESTATRSSFFSHQDNDHHGIAHEKRKSIRFVPKKFNSMKVNPAVDVSEPQPSVCLDSSRSLHLSLDDYTTATATATMDNGETINTIQTARSADGVVSKGLE